MVRKLWTYRPGLVLAALLLWTTGFCVPILTGLVNRAIFDELQGTSSLQVPVWGLLGALVVIAVVQPLLLQLWLWVHTTFETTIESLVRTNMFEWILDHAGRGRFETSPSKLVGHVRDDVPGVTDEVNEWYRLSGEAVFAVVALGIMISIDPLVTLLTFVPLALVVLLTHWLRSRLPKLWAAAREATVEVTDLIRETFGGIDTVKAAGAEKLLLERLRRLNHVRGAAEVRSRAASLRIEAVTDGIVAASQGLVLLVAARAMMTGRFSVGDFTLFVLYLGWMLMLPRRIGRLLSQRKESGRASTRLAETMAGTPVATLARHRPVHVFGELPPVVVPERVPSDRLSDLMLVDLAYHHPGSGRGIEEINLRLSSGTVTVVTGEVGAGKTTLLEVVIGLHIADAGEIRWNGKVVTDPATFMKPPRVAYKPQIPCLFSESLRDNVLLGLPVDRRCLDGALHRAAIDDDVILLEHGVDTAIGSRGVRLSGGQVQRTSAARMFVREPDLYVIDDLSSSLDEETERLVWERLDAARSAGADQATYLVVSHRPATVHRADQVVVLADGRITAVGPPDELWKHSPGQVRSLR